jgi:membrane protease YdiL (CAAX protease family)
MSASLLGKGGYSLGLTAWVLFSLVLGQSIAALIIINLPGTVNPAVQTTILAALGYALGLAIAIGLPAVVTRKPVSTRTLGINRAVSWSDIGLSILTVLPYYVVSGVLLWLGVTVFKVINPDVGQQLAFTQPSNQVEYLVAFATLVIIAPLAEELLFRGYFLGRLSAKISKWLAVIVTALVFGLLHLPGFTDTASCCNGERAQIRSRLVWWPESFA